MKASEELTEIFNKIKQAQKDERVELNFISKKAEETNKKAKLLKLASFIKVYTSLWTLIISLLLNLQILPFGRIAVILL